MENAQTIKNLATEYITHGYLPPDKKNIIVFTTIVFIAAALVLVSYYFGFVTGSSSHTAVVSNAHYSEMKLNISELNQKYMNLSQEVAILKQGKSK